jgi:glycerophosphoryl diester phosphodiesterase
MTSESSPLNSLAIVRSAWLDFCRAWRALVLFAVIFKLVDAWLLVPAVSLLLRTILNRSGRFTVTNLEILDFLMTPLGLVYVTLFGTLAIASRLLEQAGIMLVAGSDFRASKASLTDRALRLAWKALNIAKLGAVKVVLLALTSAPFVLLAVGTYWLLLSQHDIYFYWQGRPPVFWQAVAVGAVILTAATAAGLFLYVRWSFALPFALFEHQLAHVALRTSRDRVRGIAGTVGFLLVGWQASSLLLAVLAGLVYRQLALAAIGSATERPGWLMLVLLSVQALLLALVSFVAAVGQGLLLRRLYLARSEQLAIPLPAEPTSTAADAAAPSRFTTALALLSIGVVLFAPVVLWGQLLQASRSRPWVYITAHRGHARAAPENTLAAVRRAIESGADYAEIDVQLTADGKAILLHDRDLKRVAGDSRRLADLRWDELRTIDVGSWFAPAFASERIPTLDEVLSLAKGQIRLNIELKYYAPDAGLAGEVARLVRDRNATEETLVTSFDYAALREVKRVNPRQRIGIIVAHSLGDLGRLEVDALSVRADHLNDATIRSAHRLEREVHVWSVNNRADVSRWIKRGVDNLITSDPDLAVEVRREWSEWTDAEQLLHSSQLLLGI